ncbi:MAG: hypothetical protein WC322_03095 [Candidatus Paceibacterota bacterium]|jgi:hypothetical protein
MPTTPDRRPGPLEEDEEIRLIPNTDGPSQAGAFNFDGTSFVMRDTLGPFNPRSGGGITEEQHEALDTLAHEVDETSEEEVVYANGLPSRWTVWTDASKTLKIREETYTYTYTANRVTQLVATQYKADGLSKKMEVTEDYTYAGGRITRVVRTKVSY